MNMWYRIEFFSDWHCGSGLSRGFHVDAEVIRNADGLPLVPGRTVKGLLRHACSSLETYGAVDSNTTDRIFGGTERSGNTFMSRCRVSDAELSHKVSQHLVTNPELIQYLYRTIASTAIDDFGQAKDHTLRMIEVTCPLELFGNIEGVADEDVGILTQCMAYIKRMGYSRSRGLGRCQMKAVEMDNG